MITAAPNTKLGYLCRVVDNMKPDQRLELSRFDLMEILPYEHNGVIFTPADRILGNIAGSAYTHSFFERHENGSIVFERHEDTGERRYTDPDRR